MSKFLSSKLGQLLKGALLSGGSAAGAYLITNGKLVPELAIYIPAIGAIAELVMHILKKKE